MQVASRWRVSSGGLVLTVLAVSCQTTEKDNDAAAGGAGTAGAAHGEVSGLSGGSSRADGGAGGAETIPVLCDGTDRFRFALRELPNEPSIRLAVMTELGLELIIVDGNCNFWVKDGYGHVSAGVMPSEDSAQFAHEFMLGAWGPSPESCMGSWGSMRFDDAVCVLCDTPVARNASEVYGGWMAYMLTNGEPVGGPVRYSVGQEPSGGWVFLDGDINDVPFWPLSTDLLALPFDPNRVPSEAPPQVASGEDAARLRQLRDDGVAAYLLEPLSAAYGVPVRYESGGEEYHFSLAVRDVLPFEENGVLNLDELF